MKNYDCVTKPAWLRRYALGFLFIAVIMFTSFVPWEERTNADSLFQSAFPEREEIPSKPKEWVFSGEGGTRSFGPVIIIMPSGFTRQSGATVIGNMIVIPTGIEDTGLLVSGTEFAVGIWPANEQTEFDKEIQIQIALNAAQIPPETASMFSIVQYDPGADLWKALVTRFDAATYRLMASTQVFTPVARDFPNWGGRTFFAVAQTKSPPNAEGTSQARIRRNANIRSGPGTDFPVIRVARAGEIITPLYKSADGRWLNIDNNAWVAAFLVENAPLVPVTQTPTPIRP